VSFAWIFFRANTMGDAVLIITKLAALPRELANYLADLSVRGSMNTMRIAFQLGSPDQGITHSINGFGLSACAFSVTLLAVLIIVDGWLKKYGERKSILNLPLGLRWVGYCLLILVIMLSWSVNSSEFIYFTF
jgi:hypothetical protein